MNLNDIKSKIDEHFSIIKEYNNQIKEIKKKKDNHLEEIRKLRESLHKYYYQNKMCLKCQIVFNNTECSFCNECLRDILF